MGKAANGLNKRGTKDKEQKESNNCVYFIHRTNLAQTNYSVFKQYDKPLNCQTTQKKNSNN